jgi:hypothetical protein
MWLVCDSDERRRTTNGSRRKGSEAASGSDGGPPMHPLTQGFLEELPPRGENSPDAEFKLWLETTAIGKDDETRTEANF